MAFPDFPIQFPSSPHLEHAYQQLRQALVQSPALIATLSGPDHRFTFTNPGYDHLVNNRARLGCPVAECLPEAVELGFVALLDQVYRTGVAWHHPEMSLPAQAANGGRGDLYLNITYQPLRAPAGSVIGILAFIIDVTEQVKAREQARELQREVQAADVRLRHLAEALPIITFTINPEGKLSYVSPQWYAYTGQPAGGPWSDVDASWRQLLHPDDLAPVAAEIEASLAEARPMRAELRIRGADGTYRWFKTEIVSKWDEEGRLLLHHGYLLDHHELHEAQHQLQLRDQQLSQILSQLPAGIATLLGPDHRFGYSSSGYDALTGNRAVLGRPVAEQLPELVEQGFLARLDRVYQTGETYQADEVLVRLLDAETGALLDHYMALTYQALRDPQHRIIGVLVFMLDVTTATRARQRLAALQAEALAAAEQLALQARVRERELHQMKADFVTLASHEFRTPLNTILTSTSLLEHYFSAADAPNHHKHVGRIKAAIHDLTSILHGFLSLSTQAQPEAPGALELAPFLDDVLEQVTPTLRAGQRVECQLPPPGPPLLLDGKMVRHILINLLSNASKYSAEGATIYLLAEVEAAALRLTVRDAGIGIPEEDREFLFNDFFRARNATHVQGTGLGLYMVRRYVALLHGQLDFSSTLGQGTSFTVRLPLAPAPTP